ncbi:carboxylesterase/lipase family protein [Paractinoplanes abujensis]|uniref:Carboxylic ester hydrolase n=1 Tax=Paractinoplanes abujensis TaxID=882441 RepID=A0A7W7CTA6_9ACTN|nr:carboxylesterase family protein [Actinoplanes abujensis]MBB4692975.1 para-nitrobenzyl esterase [Actinoplanes abujensis]
MKTAGRWVPLLPLTVVASALAWLNRSPWWGWAAVAALLAALVLTARWWLRGRALLRTGAWLLAAVLVGATAVAIGPPLRTRVAGGEDRRATAAVPTREGPVTGVYDDDRTVEVFAGIPYARPPVGDLRWRAPEPPVRRAGVFAADRFSAVPEQATPTFLTRALAQVKQAPLEGTLLNPYPADEDSLTLNIWRSARPAVQKRPVLVYIAGGGFATGSGALPLYDGAALAARGDILTVTFNYRLGVLGFLAHPELAAESGHDASGNYGILDQIAALTWVRDNIAAFGGDPERVTVAGESAGGESVCILGATPLAAGLVDGLIGASGACMGTTGDRRDGHQADTRATAEAAGRRLSERLNGATVREMRDMPAGVIRAAAEPLDVHWRPSVDGYVLNRPPAEIYAAGDQLDVPLLAGSNADESSLGLLDPPGTGVDAYRRTAVETYGKDVEAFLRLYPGDTPGQVLDSLLRSTTDRVMTRAMHRWARLQTTAYLYYFTRVPPEEGLEKYGAYHGAEVMYAFDNLGHDGDATYTGTDHRLRDHLSAYWVNFVLRGDPNGPGLTRWPTVKQAPEQVLELGDRIAMVPRPHAAAVDFWMRYQGPIA